MYCCWWRIVVADLLYLLLNLLIAWSRTRADSENIGISRTSDHRRRNVKSSFNVRTIYPSCYCWNEFLLFELVFDVRYRPYEVYRFTFESFDETKVRCLRFIQRYFTQHTRFFYLLVYFFSNVFLLECFRLSNWT